MRLQRFSLIEMLIGMTMWWHDLELLLFKGLFIISLSWKIYGSCTWVSLVFNMPLMDQGPSYWLENGMDFEYVLEPFIWLSCIYMFWWFRLWSWIDHGDYIVHKYVMVILVMILDRSWWLNLHRYSLVIMMMILA